MSFGLKTWNNGGGLTFSSDGKVYSYLGRATLSSVTQAPNDININEAYNGFSSYSFTHAGDILVALPLKTYGATALIGTQRVGNTWVIEVFSSTGAVNSMGFDIQEATTPFIFGEPLTATGFGLAIYNEAGQLTGDLTRRPLTFDRYVEFNANSGQSAIAAGIALPAILGIDTQIAQTNTPYEPLLMTYQNRQFNGGWRLSPSGAQVQRVTWQHEFIRSTEQFTPFQTVPPTAVLIIETNGLP